MDIKLKRVIIIFFILLITFIFLMVFSEYKNIEKLKTEDSDINIDAVELRKDRLKVWAIKLVLNFTIPLLFLTGNLSKRINDFALDGRGFILSGIVYGLIFFSIIFLINLPLNFYSSYYLNHKYNLSNQDIFRWFELHIKGFLTGDFIIALFLWIPYYIIFRQAKNWWISLGLIAIPIIIFIVFISPLVIDPIFNEYVSIEDKKLEREISNLLGKAGIGDAHIYRVNKSKDTKTMNAYMTGISKSKRIVLWDTTIDNLEEKELLAITAHEIGHYIEGHIWQSIVLSIGGVFVLLFLLYISSRWVLKYSYGRFGFRSLSSYASLPLLLLILNIYLLLGNPISNYISRKMEIEADGVEIALTRDRDSAVSAMKKLSQTNLGLKRRSKLYKWVYMTHPSLEDRIEFYKKHPID